MTSALSDDARKTRAARVVDRGPWPTEPLREPPPEPTLEERVRRIEVCLWTGGEAPSWVLDAVANERASEDYRKRNR